MTDPDPIHRMQAGLAIAAALAIGVADGSRSVRALARAPRASNATSRYPTGPDPWVNRTEGRLPLFETDFDAVNATFVSLWCAMVCALTALWVFKARQPSAASLEVRIASGKAALDIPASDRASKSALGAMLGYNTLSPLYQQMEGPDPEAGGAAADPGVVALGQQDTLLGRAAKYLVHGCSASFAAAFVIVVFDYYADCQFDSIDTLWFVAHARGSRGRVTVVPIRGPWFLQPVRRQPRLRRLRSECEDILLRMERLDRGARSLTALRSSNCRAHHTHSALSGSGWSA